jgi:hypothetical protein
VARGAVGRVLLVVPVNVWVVAVDVELAGRRGKRRRRVHRTLHHARALSVGAYARTQLALGVVVAGVNGLIYWCLVRARVSVWRAGGEERESSRRAPTPRAQRRAPSPASKATPIAVAVFSTDQELHLLVPIVARLWVGQSRYGCVDLAHDQRDFLGDVLEELADAYVDLAADVTRGRGTARRRLRASGAAWEPSARPRGVPRRLRKISG